MQQLQVSPQAWAKLHVSRRAANPAPLLPCPIVRAGEAPVVLLGEQDAEHLDNLKRDTKVG